MQFKYVSMRVILVLVIILSSLSAVAGQGSDARNQCRTRILETIVQCQRYLFNHQSITREQLAEIMMDQPFDEEFQFTAEACQGDVTYHRIDMNFLPYNYRNKKLCVEWRYERDETGREYVTEAAYEEDELEVSRSFLRREFDERETPDEYRPTGRSYDPLSRLGRGVTPVFDFVPNLIRKVRGGSSK